MVKRQHNFVDRTGEIHINKEGQKVTIIAYRGAADLDIQFEDGTIIYYRSYSEVKNGSIRNKNMPTCYGKGIVGYGRYKPSSHKKFFDLWYRMLERCYSEEYHKKQPSYKGVKVCEKWLFFQIFAEWAENNYNPETMKGWQLDKDSICPDCKEYSPEICSFIPREINNAIIDMSSLKGNLPTGVTKVDDKYIVKIGKNKDKIGSYSTSLEAGEAYKKERGLRFKELLLKYKEQLDPEVYNCLFNRELKTKEI